MGLVFELGVLISPLDHKCWLSCLGAKCENTSIICEGTRTHYHVFCVRAASEGELVKECFGFKVKDIRVGVFAGCDNTCVVSVYINTCHSLRSSLKINTTGGLQLIQKMHTYYGVIATGDEQGLVIG